MGIQVVGKLLRHRVAHNEANPDVAIGEVSTGGHPDELILFLIECEGNDAFGQVLPQVLGNGSAVPVIPWGAEHRVVYSHWLLQYVLDDVFEIGNERLVGIACHSPTASYDDANYHQAEDEDSQFDLE